jgi:hypothetical protein
MSPPTPETTSIITLDSVSSRIWTETWKFPAASHVYAVETCSRSDGSAAQSPKNATSAPANATNVVSVEIQPAVRREMRPPATVIAIAPASGDPRQTQAPALIRGERSPGRRRAARGAVPSQR